MGAISLLLPVSGAGAQSLDGFENAIAAAATGTVSITPAPNPLAPGVVTSGTGSFGGLVLAGAFAAATSVPSAPGVCVGTVTAGSGIPFTTSGNLLFGYANIGSGGFAGGTAGVCTVNGAIKGGASVRVGTVALAQFQLDLTVSGPTGSGSSDDLIAEFVGTAVPGVPPCGVADFSCNAIAGPVVGYN